jgi:uncharacterized protein (TIGR00161 family)
VPVAKVTVHPFRELDVEGAHVIAAFPSVGLVATIVATHVVEALDLEQVGVMDSERFPTLSVVENGAPLNPVRIYARAGGPVVFLSEFQPSPELVRPMSEAIISWAIKHKCGSLITPEGLVMDGDSEPSGIMFAAGSSQAMRDVAEAAGAQMFPEGIVAGVTGVLLNLGLRDQFPVLALLSEAQQGEPDGRSAACVVECLSRILGVDMDPETLLGEAQDFDDKVDNATRRRRLQEGDGSEGESLMFG